MKRLLSLLSLVCLFLAGMSAAELNIYASGLRVNSVDAETNEVSINYFLNARATALEFQLLNASNGAVVETVAITDEANLTKGQHTNVSLGDALHDVVGGTYKWALKATAAATSALTKISGTGSDFILYAPKGVAVNFYPETDDFGTVYVSQPNDGASDGSSATSKAQKKGIFVWNPILELQNTGNAGYTGGITNWASGSPFRIVVAEDGKVFVDGYNADIHGVWMINGDMSGDFQKVLTNTGKCYGFDVKPSANGYSFYTMEDIVYQTSGSIKKYTDVSIPYSGAGTSIADIKNKWAQIWSDLVLDGRGGMFLSQYRGSDLTDLPILSHINSTGSFDWYSASASPSLGLSNSYRGAMGMNKDKSLLGIASNYTIKVFNVEWDSNGIPVLTLAYTVSSLSKNIDGIAFDYADNLYSVNSSSELLQVWAPIKASNTCTTPAASSRKITLSTIIDVTNVTGVTLDQTTKTLKIGDSFTLTPTIAPADASDKSHTWSSSDETVATVSNEGVVTALKAGSTDITVTTTDGGFTATCAVTVEPYTVTYNCNGGTLSKTNAELWTDFMPAYNAYYGLDRSVRPITEVTTFAPNYMQDFMTNEASPWKWLGDYILAVTTAAGRTINTEVLWRFGVSAFFNCTEEKTSTWNGNADFTTAGQPSAWLPSYTAAMLPAHITGSYTLPALVKSGYAFAGWANESGDIVTSVDDQADYTLTAQWVSKLEDAVAGKTIRRSLMNNGSLFVLAIDAQKRPYIYKINPATSDVEAVIPTTGLAAVTNSSSTSGITTMPLSDIAFTNDKVIIGCQAEHMTSNADGTFRVYKWTSLEAAPTLWFGSNETYSGGNWYNSISGVAMTYVGSSSEGQVIALANSEASNEYRFVMVNVSDGSMSSTIFNRSIINGGGTSTILTTTIGIAPQLIPSPYESDFILLGSATPPIAVTEVAHNSPATYGRTEEIPSPSTGANILIEDAVKYMFVPTSAGVVIYNITTDLASASSIKTIASANSATYRAVFAERSGNDLILYLHTDGTLTKLTDNDFFGVTINDVSLNESTLNLTIGQTEALTATVDPDGAIVTVLWSSDDESVATVSDAGVITAVGEGEAVITATASDKSATCTVTVNAPEPMAGSYTIGGDGADYASLYAACQDINTRSLSADVTFLIRTDLTETQNIGLINTSAHTLTIRPNADADRTILFTQSTDNPGDAPSGAFIIGIRMDRTTGEIGAVATETQNIILDGYAEGGSTRRLTWKTTTGFGSKAGPIVFWGHVTNSIVRNNIIVNDIYHSSTSAYGITLRNELNTNNAPEGIIIENNEINVTVAHNGQCINLNGSQALTAKTGAPKNTIIRNNILNAATRGIFLYGANGATIEGNTFNINQLAGGRLSHGILGNSQTGVITVRGNKFLQLATVNASNGAYGINAITAEGGATRWDIENNYIGGFATGSACAGKNTRICGIYMKDPCNVRHNTFVMPSLANKPSTAIDATEPITLIQYKGSEAYVVANNIFASFETTANNSLVYGALDDSFANNVLNAAGSNGKVHVNGSSVASTYADLEETCRNANKNLDVTFTSTYNIDPAYVDNPKLAVSPIEGITTDIEGNLRHTPTYAGCYEASDWSNVNIILDENATDNATLIESLNNSIVNVTLKRPFTSTEHWYTLVLPFDVTAEQLAEAFGAGTEVAVLQETYWKNDAHTDLFLRFAPQDNINAGEPCLFKPAQVINEQVVFHGVTIDNQTPSLTSDVVDMIGMYSPTDVTVNEVNYYLGNTNLLHLYVDAYKNTKGFRAYFHFDSPLPAHASARVIFHKDVVTDIEDLQSVDAPAVQKVIRDGQLIIIRDGKEFNAQGQLVR